ncbi:methyltransferase domain-containing protein [Ornithinibacillus sp. L9]|uniref:Methyltransferase domain-containing protein n=1 Tax=Ornithinibacillus caprae TaxID=2678566 RepID=A0A6N8FMY1_9BACI|nr:class I SAM-dependent methyltransferase [Ornithinibacillus caprae]MUK89764.1 methyltransferase domain-containing protein [Ornithinibacillus caprae]
MAKFDWHSVAKEQWDQQAQFWNKRSTNMWDNGSRKDIIPFVEKYNKSGSDILDVGCGDGYGSFKLQQLGYNVTGVDISSEMISKAMQRTKNISFIQSDMNELPFESGKFDGIMCINVLEWTEVPANSLQELKRVLKNDGYVCVGILGPTAGPRSNGYPRLYGNDTISNTMMPWEFGMLAKEKGFTHIDGFGVYKQGVTERNYQDLPVELKQALTFMWVFMLQKVGD